MDDAPVVEDDLTIADDAKLLRRIPPSWIKDARPDSSNFLEKDRSTGLSVTLWESAGDLQAVVNEAPTFGIVRVTGRQLRDAGYRISRVPIEGNPNHCECYGRPSGSKRKGLATSSVWVVVPSGQDPAAYGDLDQI